MITEYWTPQSSHRDTFFSIYLVLLENILGGLKPLLINYDFYHVVHYILLLKKVFAKLISIHISVHETVHLGEEVVDPAYQWAVHYQ